MRILPHALTTWSFATVVAVAIPALVSAQGDPASAGVVGPSPAAAAHRGLLDSLAAAGAPNSTAVATPMSEHYSCASSSDQRGSSAESERFAAPFGGEGAVGSGNSSTPAFSRIIVSNGPGGVGIEYLSPNQSAGSSDQPTGDIYRFDAAGLHRTECKVSSGAAR